MAVSCSCEAAAPESAVDIVLKRKDIEKIDESPLFRDIVWVDGGESCSLDKSDEFKGRKIGAGAE